MKSTDPRQSRPEIGPEMTAEQAMRVILMACLSDFDAHRAALMTDDAPVGPHGARVALRRFRTALAGFSPILRRRAARPLRTEAKALFSRLGRLRDADVLSTGLAEGAEAARLQEEADRIRAEVRAALAEREADGFAAEALLVLDSDEWKKRGKRARTARDAPVRDVAADALLRAWGAVASHGKKVEKMATADRHDFRKDLKALRYLTDFFADLWPGKAQVRFLQRLKQLQDALGVLNDLAVAEGRLGERGVKVRAALRDEAMAAAEKHWKALRKTGLWCC